MPSGIWQWSVSTVPPRTWPRDNKAIVKTYPGSLKLMSSGECCEVTINWFHRGKEVRMQRNDGRSGVTLFISYCIRQTDVFQAPGPPTGPMYIKREASITAHLFLYLQDLHEDKHGRVFSLYFLCPSHTMQLLLFSLI